MKDSIGKHQGVPYIYILPTIRFDIQSGVSLADFEAAAYYNFSVARRPILIIVEEDGVKAIKTIIQEAFFGPTDLSVVLTLLDIIR